LSVPARRKEYIFTLPRCMIEPLQPAKNVYVEETAMKGVVLFGMGVALMAMAPAIAAGQEKKDKAIGPGAPKTDKLWVFVGTYTGPKSKGIYRFEFDPTTGKAGTPELAAETANPSFLAIHPNQKFLYAVGEISGKKGGAISAFAISPKTGELTLLNQQSSGGNGPCHIVVDKTGKCVLAANYGGGSACALPIGDDGKLGEATVVQHKGKSVNEKRQEAPHAHSINLDPANRFALVAAPRLDK